MAGQLRFILFSFALLFAAALPAAAECLTYNARVQLSGTLERKTFPGPPEYESIAAGDLPETVWLLRLDAPVCVAADRNDESGVNGAVAGVKQIQLLPTDEQYRLYAKWIGSHAVLTGTLFGAATGHHRTPVLLEALAFGR